MFTIAPAADTDDVAAARALLLEYITALGLDLRFQDVDGELADFPGRYLPPAGALLLARDAAGNAAGCIALRGLAEAGACEIKRLYVRPEARGHGLGRRLAQAIVQQARRAGYATARLDTLASMQQARALYRALGFRETPPYYENPLPGAVYMALEL